MTSGEVAPGNDAGAITAVPVRHPGRWVATIVVGVLIAMFVHTLFANSNFQWDVVKDNFATGLTLHGLRITLELTVLSMAIGIVLGIVLAVMRLSPNPIVASASWIYIWFFRGTPVLVQIIFWYYMSALYPRISLGIPFGPEIWHGSANTYITPFVAAMLALGLNEGAYMAEIVRAGILSISEGQTEAAQALGMTRLLIMRRIVLPQSMRVIVPPTGNETISMLKTTALVSVIAVVDLSQAVKQIYSQSFQPIPLLIVASIWYLICTSVLTVGQYYLERYFGRGSTREPRTTMLQRLWRGLRPTHVDPASVGPAGASGEGR
jgi:polar amino acid transport system permease protein